MATPETRFCGFNIYKTSYKRIGNHEIAINVLIPKEPKPGKHPLVVKFHGGGLVQGDAMYPNWFAGYLIELILRNNAVALLPNYRLMPEHNGTEIMEDLADFWKWVDTDLAPYVASHSPSTELDFEHVLVSGDSAGGLLAFQSAITTPKDKITALLVQYPMSSYLKRLPQERLFDGSKPPGPEIIDEHMESVQPGTVVSSSIPWGYRFRVSYALSAYDRWLGFYGTDKELLPITAVEDATHFPPTWIIHGEKDTAVSVEDSKKFVKKVGDLLGDEVKGNIKLTIVDGADHGFDQEFKEEDTEWLREGLRFVEEKWLA